MKKVGRYRHTDGEANGRTDCEREREKERDSAREREKEKKRGGMHF